MSEDFTQQQPLDEQLEAERLSMKATVPPANLPGYRLEKFIGAGAFGQVWVATDKNTGRRVAIKFYLHRGGVDWSLLAREVTNLVQLSADRFIVQVLDVGWDANPPYYVMEYLESGSLESSLEARGRLPISQAIDLFYGICVGLNHSHGKGVLHCDLKPANVLLDQDLQPRLADFGQSRMTHDQTPALGTLFYMAPEQADLNAVPDARWDVYGLGAILYRMLTGAPPHRSSQLLKQIDTAGSLPKRLEQYRQAILRDGPPRDHHRRRGVDRPLAEIVDGCLAVDPDHRFANVQQVIEALDRRAIRRQRRPLVLLGIVGPLLLLVLTMVLTTRSIFETRATVAATLRQRAAESNRLAAMFAAKNFELQLRDYFQFVEDKASATELQNALANALADEEFAQLRQEVADGNRSEVIRRAFLDHPARAELQQVLSQYLAKYDGTPSATGQIDLATVFVTDNAGTMLAIAYDEPVPFDEDSTGRNFAYRAYFHGGRDDFEPGEQPDAIKPLQGAHLSPAFLSSATGYWKVAVSAPVLIQSPRLPDAPPDAVFVATTNLGGFDLMRDSASGVAGRAAKPQSDGEDSGGEDAVAVPVPQATEKRLNQVAMLVDSRPGERRGTIIQHPLINHPELDSIDSQAIQTDRVSTVPESTLDALLAKQDIEFRDPMSEFPGGEQFEGLWIAAIESVSVPRIGNEANRAERDSDLCVLVEYRWTEVIAPVGELVTKLMWYGATAVVAILVVIFLLWYMVSHSADDNRLVGADEGDGKKHSGETETIAVH
jgi:hypothetical protein